MATEIKTTFLLKRGTAERWKELNLVLQQGEPGFEYDTGLLKIGNGVTPWNELEYTNKFIYSVDTKSALPYTGNAKFIYKVLDEKLLYQWNPQLSSYEPLGVVDLPLASSNVPGIMKLYNEVGTNSDGTMTQKAIADELDDKVEVTLNIEEELLIFTN